MTYNKRGKKNYKLKTDLKHVELLGPTRKHNILSQDKFVSTNVYSSDYSVNITQWTLAIDAGKKNLGFALYNTQVFKFDLFNIDEEIIKQKLKGDMPTKRVCVLCEWFKKLIEKYNIVEMVVEKQVSKNLVCMQIQYALLTLACNYKIHYKTYDPKNKFQYIPIEFKSEKKEHKKISIHYAWNILYNIGLEREHFKSFKKKDDISDSICMALMSRETDENIIKWLITDHTNNELLKDLTKPIKFNKLE